MENKGDAWLENKDGVFTLHLNTKENRFNPTFINLVHDLLDQVENHDGPTILVTVCTNEKIWSNGLDQVWWAENFDKGPDMISDFMKLCGRLLVFPCVTIAAMNGHAFAGGLMFAMAHDYRIMRRSKGMLCLPEIDLGLTLPACMTSIVQDKLTPIAYTELMFGKRLTPDKAEQLGIITKAVEKSEFMEEVMLYVKAYKSRGENKEILGKIKYQAYKDCYEKCRTDDLQVEIEPMTRARL